MSSINDWENRALERRCSHCSRETPGTIYTGKEYLRLLQGMRGDEAEWQARKVEPFFWSDADMIHVRLCDDCSTHLGIGAAAAPTPALANTT